MAEAPIEYRIDAQDLITYVSESWDSFASANNGDEARSESVLGRPIWDFVSDMSTREIYRQALARIRSGREFRFSFRCDSPDCKRLLEMTMSLADAEGGVEFRTAVLAATPRALEWKAQGDGAAEPELLRVCGWCNRVDVHGDWVELETALAKLHLAEYPEARMITHGICDPCMAKMMTQVDALTG